MTDSTRLRMLLDNVHTIAVVGLSDKVHRPSYFVGKYLLDHGYRVIPVNPSIDEVLGQTSYACLEDVPVKLDMVNCFRRSEQMPQLAEQAIDVGARSLWMQLGVENTQAQTMALQAGLDVVMNLCIKIEHARLFGGLNWAGVNTRIISSRRPRKINL